MKVAVENITNWIFVTGVPRAGTTFMGQVLSLPRNVDYLHEPFNIGCGMPGMTQRFVYVRATPDTPAMQAYADAIRPLFTYDFTLRTTLPDEDAWNRRLVKRLIGSRGTFYLRLAKLNPFHTAAIVKDPTASFLGTYLQAAYGAKPVVVVKHPTSLAASLKRLKWSPSPHWFDQPALIDDHFGGDRAAMLSDADWDNPVEAAAAHWRLIHRVQLQQARTAEAAGQPAWHIVTHEALSADPVPTFQRLYAALDLPWADAVEQKILKLTQAEGGKADAKKGRVQDFKRDSAGIFALRRNQLTKEERQRVFDLTEDVVLELYDRASFDID